MAEMAEGFLQVPGEIHDELLVGRRPCASDLGDLADLFGDPRVGETLGGVRSEAEVGATLSRWGEAWAQRGVGPWIFRLREGAELVGYAGLAPADPAEPGAFELLYGLRPCFWARGLATRMSRLALEHARRSGELAQVVGYTLTTNLASQGVLEKLGFQFERLFERAGEPHRFYRLGGSASCATTRLAEGEAWMIRELRPQDVAACEHLLARLPDWFGIETANRGYVESLRRLPASVAEQSGEIGGFIALESHGSGSIEIHVMAVDPDLHRRGIGAALVTWAEARCRAQGVRWLHVKTRGPATPDPHYERTRRFYLAQGFEVLFESLTLWGAEDAALILVKCLDPAGEENA